MGIPNFKEGLNSRVQQGKRWVPWGFHNYQHMVSLTVSLYGRVSVRVGLLSLAIFFMILVMGPW